jgi:hypothetical protein
MELDANVPSLQSYQLMEAHAELSHAPRAQAMRAEHASQRGRWDRITIVLRATQVSICTIAIA